MAPFVVAPSIRQVAAAITTSPRLKAVLAEAGWFARRLGVPLVLIHGGAREASKEAAFRAVLLELGLPRDTRLVWQAGEPVEAIVAAAEAEGADLLIAGALDRYAAASPAFLGAVAGPVAEQARGSVLLLTEPQVEPRPFRRIVVMTDFSHCATVAFKQALWLAQADQAERVEVIAIYTALMQARAEHEPAVRTRGETEQLLREFVASAPACGVALDADIVGGTTGFAAYDFAQTANADLLVVPAPPRLGGAVPPRMNWALQVTPCSLWVVRKHAGGARPAQGAASSGQPSP
jgi:nucleotide-binding universal stress UspA family protein